jgi:TonB family protein
MFFAQRNKRKWLVDKRFTLLVSLTIHLLIFMLVKPQSLQSLTNAEISFDAGKLIINTILKDDPKKANAPVVKKKIIKKKVVKKDAKPAPKEVVLPIEKNTDSIVSKQPNVESFEKAALNPNVTPHYPRIALKRGWQGFVKIRMTINPNGKVANVQILESKAHKTLIESALEAAHQWLFKASPNGRPYLVDKRIVFQIK